MNSFDRKLKEYGHYPLRAGDMTALIVIMGHKCNMRCTHCYVDASPDSTEEMPLSTLEKILDILSRHRQITTVDVSGGAPELHPHFRYFVKSAAGMGRNVLLPSNLTLYDEPGMEDLPEFLAENRVTIIASLPHYTEEVADRQRGKGTYKKVISALKRLNSLGYGREGTSLELNIAFNPAGTSILSDGASLDRAYRDNLKEMHGITFNRLFTLNNMPIGRMRKSMSDEEFDKYMKELEERFNPDTVDTLMCRTSVSYGFDGGKVYDCDFWRVLDMPIRNGGAGIDDFDYGALSSREIVTHPLCFMCTAGSGCTCTDLLVND